MKKTITLFLASLFLLIGCNENSSILEPEEDYTVNSLSKGRPILIGDNQKLILSDDLDDIILEDELADDKFNLKLKNPLLSANDLENFKYQAIYSRTFTIDGSKGGRVFIKHKYTSPNGQILTLNADLQIPRGAFEGELTFDMIFDLENLAMELYPSPFVFDKPVLFNMFWMGLDLSSYADLDFDYLDGESENIQCNHVNIDVDNGILQVVGAELHHFSRYGWTRLR